ncbi:MAG TPA: hypothetical protein VII98_04600 [Solirubrobacteraceae bacterium]
MTVLPLAACVAIAVLTAGVVGPPHGPRLFLGALTLGFGVILADLAIGALCIHHALIAGYFLCGALTAAGLALRWLRGPISGPPDDGEDDDGGGSPRRPRPHPPGLDWAAFDRARRGWERGRTPVG